MKRETTTGPTPGPWVVETSDAGDREGYVGISQDADVHPDPDDVCRVYRRGPAGGAHDDGSHLADARLIAAAPDLYAALRAIIDYRDGDWWDADLRDGPGFLERYAVILIAAARAALARAEGKSI